MEINKKIVYGIDLILVVGTLLAAFFAFGYVRPLAISPIDDLNTTNSSVLFAFEKGSTILIDDNINFSSPEKISANDNLVINLKPGEYYWKISGARESEVRKLTINSLVGLKLRENNGNVEVVNSGNEELNVDVYDGGTLVNNFILNKDESQSVSGTKLIGEVSNE